MLSDLRFAVGATMAAAVLAVAALGLVTAAGLTGHSKVGPLEASRSLPFDSGAHWNQFYHPDSARRFEDLARKREVAQSGIEPSDTRQVDDRLSPIPAEGPIAVAPDDRLTQPSADGVQGEPLIVVPQSPGTIVQEALSADPEPAAPSDPIGRPF
jgi:hypothetical protein